MKIVYILLVLLGIGLFYAYFNNDSDIETTKKQEINNIINSTGNSIKNNNGENPNCGNIDCGVKVKDLDF